MRKAYVIGVGMTKFTKPTAESNYLQFAKEAAVKALEDCKTTINQVEQAFVSYVYGDSGYGQNVIYNIGMTGMPIFNVHNMCASGSTALYLGKEAVECGRSECVMVLGFEKMEKGSIRPMYKDRAYSLERHMNIMKSTVGIEADVPFPPQLFGCAGEEHMNKYGTKPEHFAKIAEKNHRHSINNPYSQYQDKYSLEQILESPRVFGILTRLQCSSASDGAASAIVASKDFVYKHMLQNRAVEIVGMEMATDLRTSFDKNSCIDLSGYDMTRNAAKQLFTKTNYKPDDVQVVELHDGFSVAELIYSEALGLCKPGEIGKIIDRGDNTYGGKFVVNPSGGLISRGHPIGATGVAQCVELCWQLRGEAGKRQVESALLGLQHSIGLSGGAIVALYRLGFPKS